MFVKLQDIKEVSCLITCLMLLVATTRHLQTEEEDKGGGRDPWRDVSAMMNSERGYVDQLSTFHNTRSAGMVTKRVSLESPCPRQEGMGQ